MWCCGLMIRCNVGGDVRALRDEDWQTLATSASVRFLVVAVLLCSLVQILIQYFPITLPFFCRKA